MNVQQLITENLAKEISNRFDEIIIQGLKLKRHEFQSRLDLEKFIKQRCKCVDDFIDEVKFYYVDDKPFLEHNYKHGTVEITFDNNSIVTTVSMGSYRFV